jgi:hypothetical protein
MEVHNAFDLAVALGRADTVHHFNWAVQPLLGRDECGESVTGWWAAGWEVRFPCYFLAREESKFQLVCSEAAYGPARKAT